MARKKPALIGGTIGGVIAGFDQQVFRTTPPVSELVAKGAPLRAVAADDGGTVSVEMPGDAEAADPEAPDPDVLRLTAPRVEAVIDLINGGRIASFVVDGRELLVTHDPDTFRWGAYPMAPYAGRVRRARFEFRGRSHRLPIGIPPHAIHGTVLHRRWRRLGDDAIETDLGPDWPFAGRVVQRFALTAGRFELRMELHAHEPMPASIGWHPWFARRPERIGAGGPKAGEPVATAELDLDAGAIYEKDADGITTRRRLPPPPGPWDECFTDLRRPPVVRWPGFLEHTLESDCRDWVVFTEPADALCIEPQTAPPGALEVDAAVVEPGAPSTATMTWRWRTLAR
jgi:aldose 1-epimerase